MTDLRGRHGVPVAADRCAPPVTRAVRWALSLFAVLVAGLTVVVGLVQPDRPRDIPYLTGPGWLDGWIQYDSGWYWAIATDGYSYTPGRQSSIAFFPTYPLIVRGVAAVGGDVQIAGMLVTVLAGAAAVALFVWWVWTRLPTASARTSILLLLLYPYAFFLYGTMYADAVFLLTVIGAFVLLERGHPWLAGLVGILATAGRPVGIAVAVGLAVRVLEMRAEAKAADGMVEGQSARPAGTDAYRVNVPFRALVGAVRDLRLRDVGVAVSVLGFVAWCTYLGVAFGNPLAFVAAEASPGWDQGSGPRTWFKVALLGQLRSGDTDIAVTLAIQALMCLAAVLLLRRVWRRFGWGYLAYVLVVVGIPLLGTKDFMGTGRYLIAAFPVIAAAGDALATSRHVRWLRPVLLVVFAIGLVAGTILYARGYEVS